MQGTRKILTISMCIVVISNVLTGCNTDNTNSTEATETMTLIGDKTIIHTDKKPEEALYISDTVYSGEEIDTALYEVPFGDSKDSTYICNKDYLSYLESTDYTSDDFIDSATAFINDNLNLSYVDLLNNQDEFEAAVENYSQSEITLLDYREYASLYAQDMMQWYIDNKMEISCKFTTDKSLLYDYGCPTLRGKLEIKLNGGDRDAFYEKFGVELSKNNTVTLMCEVKYSDEPNNIMGVYLVGYME